ncbi:hypothetical protein HDZ31DRAFT_70198, partial [Schizophyllum fasciatum]
MSTPPDSESPLTSSMTTETTASSKPFTSTEHSSPSRRAPRPSHAAPALAPPSTKSTAYNKFILYENRLRFYIVASNAADSRHRIIKIDRTAQDELS